MRSLYSHPLRVYVCLGFLALVGIYSGWNLPVSLFPNSSKPRVDIQIGYGSSTADEFLNTYGRRLEKQLQAISAGAVDVDKITATYDPQDVTYEVQFKWGTPGREALKEVQLVVLGFAAQFPQEMRDSVQTYIRNDNAGFLAVSFYSDTRTLDDLYNYLEPIFTPAVSKVPDASDVGLWNPSRKEIQIQLDPEKLASLQLFPRDVAASVLDAISGSSGGDVKVGIRSVDIIMPRQAMTMEQLGGVLVPTPAGHLVRLSDIATIDLGAPTSNDRSFKTSGEPSLILFADPKPGGNIKRMAENVIDVIHQIAPTLPKDIHYKILVDPSEFIRHSVRNVFREVCLAAILAVGVLFLFIGSLKNVVTAAIEIPMSIVLAFILMRISGINLNLISLGGLALSAGMNVDASVVVMENIFRHFEMHKGPMTSADRLRILVAAVKEVEFPVIASTIASLVVFIPLAFTSDLSNAILGDLALAVVFSHGFSAVVALVLVPTVRLQVMALGGETAPHSPVERPLRWLERQYGILLKRFLSRAFLKWITYLTAVVALVILAVTVIPRLPKEVIGIPDTDWVVLNMSTEGNTMVRQMEEQAEEAEAKLLQTFPNIQYTFTQVYDPNNGDIMSRLIDKSLMQPFMKNLERTFPNTPSMHFDVEPWNPSELPIPHPPQLRVAIRGGDSMARTEVGRKLLDLFEEHHFFPNQWTDPSVNRREMIVMHPHREQWDLLQNEGVRLLPSDLADISRVATTGRHLSFLPVNNRLVPIVLQFPQNRVASLEDLASFPIGVGGKLIPIKALMNLRLEEMIPTVYREDQRELIVLNGRSERGEEATAPKVIAQAKKVVDEWKVHQKTDPSISINFEDSQKELTSALHQLVRAIVISILLIFVTMVLQFGNIMNALIVLAAIPLGIIGVLISLFVFHSTLSLNSALGVILLNGIVVANSIILVDFMCRLVLDGLPPRVAAVEAAQKRLRPILMTSLTTGLGMLPVALGLGDGGRILQPLGIAVTGGLVFSVFLTLFIVPALQVSYLEWKQGRRHA